MDWTEVPAGLGGKVDVSVWHELVQDHSGSSPPPELKASELGTITVVWQSENLKPGELVEFTHANFIAAVASLLVALPFVERLVPSDLVLPADSLTNAYCLSQTLVALWSGASIVLCSVAGPEADLTFATSQISPTVVIVTAESAAKLHTDSSPAVQSGIGLVAHRSQSQTLAGGNMPLSSIITTMSGNTKAKLGAKPDYLRLVYITEKAHSINPSLSSRELSDLRIFTGAHVVYALTAAPVAGAIAQTHYYDYRVHDDAKRSHFGGPLGSLEVRLIDTEHHRTNDDVVEGEVCFRPVHIAGSAK
jgi:AMP-binding enzyme